MRVTADFYVCDSDRRNLYKNISLIFTTDFVFYENSSIMQPRLRLAYNANITGCNYMYIPVLNRYYFIDDISFNNAGEMIVTGQIDVLETYQQQIAGITCNIARYENYDLSLCPDTNILIKNYNIINIYKSDSGFDTTFGDYVLQIVGG